MRIIKNLPNILTLINLFLGCLAIIYIFYDHFIIIDAQRNTYVDMGKIEIASLCIFIAAIIDFLDGFVARLLHAQSAIGKQLDSLADVVTFGVVPGVIMYQLIARSYYTSADAFDYPILYYAIGFVITMGAAYRLAKFNVDERQTTEFLGLPTPAMALFVASLPILILRNEFGMAELLTNKWILIAMVFLLTYLMVSEIPMMSLKIKSLGWKENSWTILLIIISGLIIIFCVAVLQSIFIIIPILILTYILLSIIKNIKENGI